MIIESKTDIRRGSYHLCMNIIDHKTCDDQDIINDFEKSRIIIYFSISALSLKILNTFPRIDHLLPDEWAMFKYNVKLIMINRLEGI